LYAAGQRPQRANFPGIFRELTGSFFIFLCGLTLLSLSIWMQMTDLLFGEKKVPAPAIDFVHRDVISA